MKFISYLLVSACCITSALAQDGSVGQASDNGRTCGPECNCMRSLTPAGVTTDHIHGKGEWMASYTYMNTMQSGGQMGAGKASDNAIYEQYMMAPESMNMQMHMAMLMYGATDRLTLMAMGGYTSMNMKMNMGSMSMPGMIMPMGDMSMNTSSSGITDTRLSALYNFAGTASHRIIGSLGVDLPTGSIKTTGTTMLGDNQRLPYNMQPGSGSFGIAPDITWIKSSTTFSYGANAGASVKLNNNSLGYRVGNTYHVTAWAAHRLASFVSFSLRAEFVQMDKISGSDVTMDAPYYQVSDPTTVTANYGGKWASGYAGLNFHAMKPVLERFILLTEYGRPFYQYLNGVQTATTGVLTASLQYAIK